MTNCRLQPMISSAMTRLALGALLTAGTISFASIARADTAQGIAATACATPPTGYTAPYQFTQNTAGRWCTESTCGVSPPVTYVPGRSYPILIDSNGNTCTN